VPGFPRQSRLLAPDEFKRAFAQRPVARGRYFTAHRSTRPTADAEPAECFPLPRLGIVIPKKLLKTAVHRNLVKRLTRESFRASAERLPAGDFVIRLSAKLDPRAAMVKRREIAEDLATLFARLTVAGARA
jgi:ribonuclease P protein component